VNILVFLILGTVLPYFLTGGGSSPTKVRLQPVSPEALKQALDLYVYCHPNATCEYKSVFVQEKLPLILNGYFPCPFQESCVSSLYYNPELKRTKLLQRPGLMVMLKDINPSYYGLNLDNRFRHGYLLTCAPLNTQWYLL